MRYIQMILLAGAALSARPAIAADVLKFAPPPAWVREQAIPPAKPTDAPMRFLLEDEQISLQPGKITSYNEGAIKIQNSQGLAAGNLAIVWQPATDTVTVNKLQIIRGDKVIDVLKSGQTFTVLRRETNLDAATLDGTLTATIQPEGLQEGDVIDLATTTERSDPVMKGHVEAMFSAWDGVPIELAHAMLSWPSNLHIDFRETSGLPSAERSTRNGLEFVELSARNIEPTVQPKGAPQRFVVGRLAEATDFRSWADLASLMAPLYREASIIPTSGPLHDEVEKIRSSAADPKARAAQALALVQDRVRYVALLMGQGGYVPASAEQTWSRRFGDCKGKTALLLGVLHSLGIEAEPVLVQAKLGDMIADRLPMIELFNHVLVRARVGGKDYWLDGTRTGETDLDSIQVPDFGWGLPLIEHAQLVHMVPAPLDKPEAEVALDVDASGGVYAPAPTTAKQTVRGDAAVALQSRLSTFSKSQLDEFFRNYWTALFDFLTFKSAEFSFDKTKRELHLNMAANAKLDWSGGQFHVPNSSVGYHPNFDRQQGPLHDVPFAVDYPSYTKWTVRLNLPPSFIEGRRFGAVDVHETLAGVQYNRTSTITGNTLTVETSERSLVPEISYKDAKAAEARLIALDGEDVALPMPGNYRLTRNDMAALPEQEPGSADDFVRRGDLYLDAKKFDLALADFNEALKLQPDNKWALADRGLAYVWKQDFKAAEKDLASLAALDPDNGVLLRAQGLMAQLKDDCPKAIDFFTRSLANDPENGFAMGRRAQCEASQLKYNAALADSARALKADPSWMDLRVMRANIFMRQGKRDLVAGEAETLIRENPDSNFAWVAAAMTYSALGQRERAMQALDRALAIKPEAYIYVNRARARPRSDVTQRIADLDAALKLEPDNEDALRFKAQLLADKGDYKGGVALLDRIKVAPDDQYAQTQRAILLYKAGETGAAEKLLQSVRSAASTASQLNSLCWAKATRTILLDSALQDCRDALKLSPDHGSYLDSLGMVLLKLGKLEEALDAYNKALANGSGAASLMGRGFVYLRKGDRARAEADFAAARKLSPTIDDDFREYGLEFDERSAGMTPRDD